jgi:error-prone DNA polymerase
VVNVIVWPKTYEPFRRAVIAGRLLRITGKLQREGSVSHLIAWRIENLSPWLDRLGMAPDAPGNDAARHPAPPRARHPREQAKRLFPSRDFH